MGSVRETTLWLDGAVNLAELVVDAAAEGGQDNDDDDGDQSQQQPVLNERLTLCTSNHAVNSCHECMCPRPRSCGAVGNAANFGIGGWVSRNAGNRASEPSRYVELAVGASRAL